MPGTFCVLPWYSREILKPSLVELPCCLLKDNFNLEQVKKDLLAGVQTPACSACWTIESSGQQSRRQQENIFLDYKLDQDIEKIQQDCVNGTNETLMYQIRTSNLCNQACVSCNSFFSTKWAEIEKRMSLTPQPLLQTDLDHAQINYQKAKRISLLGGEPLFDPKTFEILENLIANKNTDCFISLVTNGSITLTPKQINLLNSFSELNICVSIDGIGSVAEYMRWPCKWDKIISNIGQYRSIAKTVSVSYTISSLNALYYNRTVEWFNQNNLSFNHNIVESPGWLNLKYMPKVLKQYLHKEQNFISSFCNISGAELPIETVLRHVDKQDIAKKIKMQDYMPEVWQLLTGDNL